MWSSLNRRNLRFNVHRVYGYTSLPVRKTDAVRPGRDEPDLRNLKAPDYRTSSIVTRDRCGPRQWQQHHRLETHCEVLQKAKRRPLQSGIDGKKMRSTGNHRIGRMKQVPGPHRALRQLPQCSVRSENK